MTEEIIIERGCVHCSLCSEDEECYWNRCKRLEQENKELKEKFNFMETANDIKKLDIDSLRDTNYKLRSALEEIKSACKDNRLCNSKCEYWDECDGHCNTVILNKTGEVLGND